MARYLFYPLGVKVLLNENNGELDKELIFIALGGNESLYDSSCVVDGTEYPIHTASWFNMLHAVDKLKASSDEGRIHRLLSDIIHAFTIHGFFNYNMASVSKANQFEYTINITDNRDT